MRIFNKRLKNDNSSKGFTLIEFLLYGMISVIIVGAMVMMSVNVMQSRAQMRTLDMVNNTVRFSLNKMTLDIRKAESFTVLSGGDELELEIPDKETTKFFLQDSVLYIQRGLGDAEPLTVQMVNITDLAFTDVTHPDTLGTIRIDISAEYSNPLNRSELNHSISTSTTENLREKRSD